jgi:putative colanic acid biosynthesis glycosyltransferase WcaI
MRILILTVNYWPEETGIGALTTWRCEYLASQGHEVVVCTTFPYYPEWRVAESYRGKFWHREVRNGVTILRSWSWIPGQVTSAKRILFEASFLAGNLIRSLTAKEPDLIMVVSPPLGLGLSAGLLSRAWGIPFVFDVMDLQPDAAAELGMLRSVRLMRALYWLERYAYKHASLVSTLTEGMRRRIIAKSTPPEKVVLFATRADSELLLLEREQAGQSFRRTHKLEEKFIVAHSGNMGVKQGLDVILRAAELSRDHSEIVYLLVGDGAMRRQLESQAADRGLENVKFLPVLPREQFLQMLAAANICLVTQQRSVADIVFPSKTTTLMTAGCPIIASVNDGSEVARVLKQSSAGLVIPPEDPARLLEAIMTLKWDVHYRSQMSEAGRLYAREQWAESTVLPRMESELLRIADKIPNPLQVQVRRADV